MTAGEWVDFKAVKATVTMTMVLGHYSITLRPQGQHSLRGRCPLPTHKKDSSAPSFGVNTSKNAWSCQSDSCVQARRGRKGGNVLDFVAWMEKCSVRDAALKLQSWFNVATPEAGDTPVPQLAPEKNTAEPPTCEPKAADATNPPLTFVLKGVEPAHPYLTQRGIDPQFAQEFGIGFFPGKGLMTGRIVIPIHNEHQELVAYAGRAVDSSEPKYKLPPKFTKTAVLYNLHRVLGQGTSETIVVVEGFFDCLKVHQAGYRAVALMGCSLSDAQEKLLEPFRYVIVMLDGDDAGRKASTAIASRLVQRQFTRVVVLSDGQQPDSMTPEEIRATLNPYKP